MIDSVEMSVLLFCLSGAIAQLGERIAGSDEVRGSIPLGSTKIKLLKTLVYQGFFFVLSGRYVFFIVYESSNWGRIGDQKNYYVLLEVLEYYNS